MGTRFTEEEQRTIWGTLLHAASAAWWQSCRGRTGGYGAVRQSATLLAYRKGSRLRKQLRMFAAQRKPFRVRAASRSMQGCHSS